MIRADPRPPGAIEPEATWCRVCGEIIWLKRSLPADAQRCFRHRDRNPCAIEGCKKTMKANGQLAVDQVMCGVHWRSFVPIGSAERRIYNRFQRRARRFGWTDESYGALCRIWDCIVRRARARSAGDIDEADIRRLFGWAAE